MNGLRVHMFEKLVQKFDGMENLRTPRFRSTRRPRADSGVSRCLVASFFIGKLKANLRKRRLSRKAAAGKTKTKSESGTKIKPVSRVGSGLAFNKKRNDLLAKHMDSMANEQRGLLTGSHKRAGTPDAVYDDSGLDSLPGSVIHRSSSMSRLTGIINAQAEKSRKNREHLECYRLGKGSFIGFSGPSAYIRYQRGQLQLRKMAEVFQEASRYDGRRDVSASEKVVQLLLKSKNKREKDKKSGMKWSLLTGRIVGRDPGRTGVVEVEKLVVILSRRRA